MPFAYAKLANRTFTSLALAGVATLAAAPARAQEAPPVVVEAAPTVLIAPPSSARIHDWEPGEPVPPGYHAVKRRRKGLLLGGGLTFGVTYFVTALAGAIAADAGAGRGALLLLPVFGPLGGMGGSATTSFLLALDSLAQAAGVAVFAVGMAKPRPVLVRDDLAKIEVAPAPLTFGSHGVGFGLVGRF